MIKKWCSQEEASFAWQRLCESFRSFPQGLNFWGKCEMSSEVKARVPTRSSVKGANKHEVSVTGWGHQLCWLNMSLQRCTLTTLSVHSKICPSFTTQLAHAAPPVGAGPVSPVSPMPGNVDPYPGLFPASRTCALQMYERWAACCRCYRARNWCWCCRSTRWGTRVTPAGARRHLISAPADWHLSFPPSIADELAKAPLKSRIQAGDDCGLGWAASRWSVRQCGLTPETSSVSSHSREFTAHYLSFVPTSCIMVHNSRSLFVGPRNTNVPPNSRRLSINHFHSDDNFSVKDSPQLQH